MASSSTVKIVERGSFGLPGDGRPAVAAFVHRLGEIVAHGLRHGVIALAAIQFAAGNKPVLWRKRQKQYL